METTIVFGKQNIIEEIAIVHHENGTVTQGEYAGRSSSEIIKNHFVDFCDRISPGADTTADFYEYRNKFAKILHRCSSVALEIEKKAFMAPGEIRGGVIKVAPLDRERITGSLGL